MERFPSGSGPKIGLDRLSVHTGPAIRTGYLVWFRSDFWTCKKVGVILKLFESQIGPAPCRSVLVPTAQFRHGY